MKILHEHAHINGFMHRQEHQTMTVIIHDLLAKSILQHQIPRSRDSTNHPAAQTTKKYPSNPTSKLIIGLFFWWLQTNALQARKQNFTHIIPSRSLLKLSMSVNTVPCFSCLTTRNKNMFSVLQLTKRRKTKIYTIKRKQQMLIFVSCTETMVFEHLTNREHFYRWTFYANVLSLA